MTEREKRDLGLWYDANYDAELLEEREKAEEALLCIKSYRSPGARETK